MRRLKKKKRKICEARCIYRVLRVSGVDLQPIDLHPSSSASSRSSDCSRQGSVSRGQRSWTLCHCHLFLGVFFWCMLVFFCSGEGLPRSCINDHHLFPLFFSFFVPTSNKCSTHSKPPQHPAQSPNCWPVCIPPLLDCCRPLLAERKRGHGLVGR